MTIGETLDAVATLPRLVTEGCVLLVEVEIPAACMDLLAGFARLSGDPKTAEWAEAQASAIRDRGDR